MRAADPLLPRPPGGMGRGAGLALVVHGGLIAALTLGVSWRMQAPEVVSAELWAAVPEFAAPRVEETPPPPPPTPVPKVEPPPKPVVREAPPPPNEAQIAIERAERKKREEQAEREQAEREKAEQAQKKREADEKKRRDQEAQKAEQARIEKSREEQMKRMFGTLQQGTGSPTSTGRAARDAAPSQAYQDRLRAAIRSQINIAGEIPGNPEAEVVVNSTASGTIVSHRLGKSSGVKEWDDAVLRAFDRLGTLPRNPDGAIPETMTVRLRPKE